MTARRQPIRRQQLTAIFILVGSTGLASSASAQKAPSVNPSVYTQTSEPSSTVNEAALAVGAIGLVVLSGGFVGLTYGPQLPFGCNNQPNSFGCDQPRDHPMRGPTIAMLTSGATALAFSGGLLLSNRGQRHRHAVMNDPKLGSGIILAGVGMSGIVGATAAFSYGMLDDAADEGHAIGFSALMGLTSVAIFAVGAPLWLTGGRSMTYDPYGALPPTDQAKVRRSPTMMIGGIAFTTAGAALLATGLATTAQTDSPGAFIPNLLLGGPLLGLGIPLWVKGAANVRPENAYALAPKVQIAPGSMQLDWTF